LNFSQKTFFISGGSRGIGRAIALKLAQRGANIAIAAKTATARSDLDGTIHTVADEIEQAGGTALPIQCDIREEEQVEEAIAKTVSKFGGLDGLVNNASAISVTGTLNTKMKTYDLMNEVNARGTFLCSQKALPHLLKSSHPHILNLSPPLNLHPKWFKNNTAYTIAKYGMSMCVLGMAEEFKNKGVGVNALWPLTTIATAAIENNFGEKYMKMSRSPDIVADAAIAVLSRNPKSCTGNFFIDEEVLKEEGITDFGIYSYEAGSEVFFADGFLPDEVLARTSTKLINIYDG
jgi:citronellol/citronellal dehydrogenase